MNGKEQFSNKTEQSGAWTGVLCNWEHQMAVWCVVNHHYNRKNMTCCFELQTKHVRVANRRTFLIIVVIIIVVIASIDCGTYICCY